MSKSKSPATCVSCMGRGRITETKTGWGADEKGLPIRTRETTISPCGDCDGKGTK